jgi:lysophospholipase L1-like esterase
MQLLYAQSTAGIPITASGKLATVSLPGHGFTALGQEACLSGNPDDAMNGGFPVVSILSKDQFVVQLDSVPANPNSGPLTQVGVSHSWASNGLLLWLAAYLGWQPKLLSCQAFGGATTAQVAARAHKVASYQARYVFLLAGINDGDAITPATSVANLRAFCDAQLAVDSIVIIFSDMPVSAGYGNLSPTAAQRIVERNRLLQRYVELTPGTVYIGADAVMVNAGDVNGYGQAAMTFDGLHQTAMASEGIARRAAQTLNSIIVPNLTLVSSPIDSRLVNPSSRNVFGNPLFLSGPAGKLLNGITGEAANNWALFGSGITGVGSLVPRTDATVGDSLGNTQQLVLTQTAAFGNGGVQSYVSPAGYFGAGDLLRVEGEVSVSGLSNVINVYAQLVVFVGGQKYTGNWSSSSKGAYPQSSWRLPIRMPEMPIPAGAITLANMTIGVTFGAGTTGTATLGVARAGCFKV